MSGFGASKPFFGFRVRVGAGWGVAKIELPEGWAGVAEPLRALMVEIDRGGHAEGATTPDLAAEWARVSEAIRATVRARIADAGAEAVAVVQEIATTTREPRHRVAPVRGPA